MHRLALIKEIFWKPTWGILGFSWFIVGNILNILGLFDIGVSDAREAVLNSPYAGIVLFFVDGWWFITATIIALAIAEGIYRKAYPYLGDRIKLKKISFRPLEEHPSRGNLYAALSIVNGEDVDLCRCEARLTRLKIFALQEWIDIPRDINPNGSLLTWPAYDDRDDVVIISNRSARLNIARTDGVNNAVFIFRMGDKRVPISHSKFYIEVTIDAKVGEKRIEEVVFTGFLLDETKVVPAQAFPILGEITHPDGTITTSIKMERVLPSTTRKLYIRPGRLIGGEMVYAEQEG